jgi:hypothetical protein
VASELEPTVAGRRRSLLQPLRLRGKGQEMQGTLKLVEKLSGLGWLNAIAARQLIHMLDQNTNRPFLVDTGVYSIIPHHSPLPITSPKRLGTAGQPDIRIFLGNFF